jgi:type I restriction enzyme S subunit
LNYCLNASEFREYCSQVKSDGVSQSNINAQKLAAYEMPWCPIEEQTEIVCRLKGLLGGLGNVEQSLANGRLRAERITQSILGKAFAGELVETEADLARREGRDYEPASMLLERIASQREQQSKQNSSAGVRNGRPSAKQKKAVSRCKEPM